LAVGSLQLAGAVCSLQVQVQEQLAGAVKYAATSLQPELIMVH